MKLLSRASCAMVMSWALCGSHAQASVLELFSPDWSITLTSYGYSDLLFDQRPGYEGREYLSGEWGAAVQYTKAGVVVSPTWLEPEWIFPDWTTNSTFGVDAAISAFASPDLSVIDAAMSVISNGDLRITQVYEMIDTTYGGASAGVEQGYEPAVTGSDPGASITSNRYVLRHTYDVENVSGEEITDVNLFQFLHSLNASEVVYDDRDYGGTFGEYKYDVTERGIDGIFGDILFDDIVAFHSRIAPTAFEVGRYGDDTVDDHVLGKPSVGVHYSVEGDSLDGTDYFMPPNLWVGGAQKFALTSSLGVEDHVVFDVLLSISTTDIVPEPSAFALMGLGAVGLIGIARRRKTY